MKSITEPPVVQRILRQSVCKSEIARANDVSTRTVENWMRLRLIPFMKIGSVVRFDPDKVTAALSRFEVKGRSD